MDYQYFCFTDENITAEMKRIKNIHGDDSAAIHREMDNFLCAILWHYGHKDAVGIFENASLWYA